MFLAPTIIDINHDLLAITASTAILWYKLSTIKLHLHHFPDGTMKSSNPRSAIPHRWGRRWPTAVAAGAAERPFLRWPAEPLHMTTFFLGGDRGPAVSAAAMEAWQQVTRRRKTPWRMAAHGSGLMNRQKRLILLMNGYYEWSLLILFTNGWNFMA